MSKIQIRTLFRTFFHIASVILIMLALFSCKTNPENRPSPLVIENAQLDSIKIKLTYSSPAVRDRKIFGHGADYLEQYEDLWRTGANKATTIHISNDIFVDTYKLDSGKYAIFTIPGEEKWTLIFNKNWEQWGSYDYIDSLDVFRIDVPAMELKEKEERMRLYINNDSLKFKWNLTTWGVPLSQFP